MYSKIVFFINLHELLNFFIIKKAEIFENLLFKDTRPVSLFKYKS